MGERLLHIECPCCGARLAVEAETGTVLSHEAKEAVPARDRSMADLVSDLDRKRAEREAAFSQEMESLKDRGRKLDEKFKEALEKAAKDPSAPPLRDIDLD